jgi:hypothetical protein
MEATGLAHGPVVSGMEGNASGATRPLGSGKCAAHTHRHTAAGAWRCKRACRVLEQTWW